VTLNAEPLEQRQRLIVARKALVAATSPTMFVVAQPLHAGDHWQDSRQTGPSGI
jgi:hypothetical protein